jgi:hypothetical protein
MDSLNQNGQKFAHAIASARRQFYEVEKAKNSAEKLHIVGAGRALTSAYEQLRNAAEYTEEHLLLQRAIRRFYKRTFLTNSAADIHTSGDELITELTLAGYIKNDSVPVALAKDLSILASEYYSAYSSFHSPTNDQADRWWIAVLAVEVEVRLNDLALRDVFVDSLANGIAAAVSSGSIGEGFKALGQTMLAGLGDMLIAFGRQVIATAGLFEALRAKLVGVLDHGAIVDGSADAVALNRLARGTGQRLLQDIGASLLRAASGGAPSDRHAPEHAGSPTHD